MKTNLLVPGIFMKRAGYVRMGALGMGIFVCVLLISLTLSPVIADACIIQDSVSSCQGDTEVGSTRSKNNETEM